MSVSSFVGDVMVAVGSVGVISCVAVLAGAAIERVFRRGQVIPLSEVAASAEAGLRGMVPPRRSPPTLTVIEGGRRPHAPRGGASLGDRAAGSCRPVSRPSPASLNAPDAPQTSGPHDAGGGDLPELSA